MGADTLEELNQLTIVRVDGFAVDGGLQITMPCNRGCRSIAWRHGFPDQTAVWLWRQGLGGDLWKDGLVAK